MWGIGAYEPCRQRPIGVLGCTELPAVAKGPSSTARPKLEESEAILNPIHPRPTCHTFARLVSDEAGSLTDVQHALGHQNLATTKVYAQRVGLKKDRYSGGIARRLGLESQPADDDA